MIEGWRCSPHTGETEKGVELFHVFPYNQSNGTKLCERKYIMEGYFYDLASIGKQSKIRLYHMGLHVGKGRMYRRNRILYKK